MSGTRQKIQYALALEPMDRVNPLSAAIKGPNHSRRRQNPKARPQRNNKWRRCATERTLKERGNAFEETRAAPAWMG